MGKLANALRLLVRRLLLWMLCFLRLVFGRSFIKMNFHILSQLVSASEVLRLLGARVGTKTHIPADICVYNLGNWSCHNLTIGSNVYIGPRCLFDLTSKVTIADDAAISAQVSFITHLDVGNQPLKQEVARTEGPVAVGRGAWIGVNTTVLQNVTIGEFSMVGAMSLVNRDVPARTLAYGIPCRVRRQLNGIENNTSAMPGPAVCNH